LTFSGYINQKIQKHEDILPKVNRLAGETIDTSLDILGIIETLDPEKTDEWHGKTQNIVDAVMAAMPKSLDPNKVKRVTTAVVYDMANLSRGFNPRKVGRDER
jgi:hypothetical protein